LSGSRVGLVPDASQQGKEFVCYIRGRGYLVQLCNCQRLMKGYFIKLLAGYLLYTLNVPSNLMWISSFW